FFLFFFSSRRRHTRFSRDWSSDVCSSDLASVEPEMAFEVEGVNDRVQLAALERQFQACQAKQLMQQGVHLIDPSRFDLRGNLTRSEERRVGKECRSRWWP